MVSVFGDRNFVVSRQEQYRGVFGIKGDLPFINFGPGNDWTFELSGVHSYSKGTSSRIGIRGDKLALALGLDPTVPSPTRAMLRVSAMRVFCIPVWLNG